MSSILFWNISKEKFWVSVCFLKHAVIWFLGEYVSPSSSRFITSHDQYSGSTVVIEMFFKAVAQYRPDLVILSGVHLLESQVNLFALK